MELRQIDGRNFIVQAQGKREHVRTVAEFIGIAERTIRERRAAAEDCRDDIIDAQNQLEAALLVGDSAEEIRELRSKVAGLREIEAGFHADTAEAETSIKRALALVDDHDTDKIKQADADRLEALTTPFDAVLKEHAQ
ncbi:MAG: hypothetical protein Q8O38_16595 [Sulfurimicrobium sp.]|nr:hypothetical protein [Sulfurimicrobium sp.]